MSDCLFCKIISGDIPSSKVYEDDEIFGFKDINPAAPVHVLFVPKKHFADLSEASPEDQTLLGRMLLVISREAPKLGLTDGYRVVNNCGISAGQTIRHFHLHLLGGKQMSLMC